MNDTCNAPQDFTTAPAIGTLMPVAPGIVWARFPLPFTLNHVNIYLIEDDGGWAVVDAGIGDAVTQAAWEAIFAGPLAGQKITRLIITHHHPDHAGLAGWLAARFDAPVHMTEAEYLISQYYNLNRKMVDEEIYRRFYRQHGMGDEYAGLVISQGHYYKRIMTQLPWSYWPLVAGDVLRIGGRDFEILTGGGHSSDQAMLWCRQDRIFLAADQVLLRISPNISVFAITPEANPLGQYLRSLGQIRASVPDDVVVLPGHNMPFRTLHQRIGELEKHHETRCDLIEAACLGKHLTAAELVPVLFKRALDPHQMSFAFSETLAHVNLMINQKRLAWIADGEIRRAVAV